MLVIDVAMAGRCCAQDVVRLLETFPGVADTSARIHDLLGLMHSRLERNRDEGRTMAKMMERLGQIVDDDDLYSCGSGWKDTLDCWEEGISTSDDPVDARRKIIDEFLEILAGYKMGATVQADDVP